MRSYKSENFKRLKKILRKHQSHVWKISVVTNEISEKKLIKLLSLLPNLEEVTLDVLLKKTSETSQQKLSHLHHLKILHCLTQAAKIVFELPNNVLTTLSFKHTSSEKPPSDKLLQSVFEKQKNIIEFSFNPEAVESFKLPALKKLQIFGSMSKLDISEILESQQNLSSLAVQHFLSTEEFIIACRIKSLQCLKMKLMNVDSVVLNINQLTDLRKLQLDLSCSADSDFVYVSLPLLEELKLKVQGNINLKELISMMPTNFPCLKQLVLSSNLSIEDTQDLYNLLQNPNLEMLEVTVCQTLRDPSQLFGNFHEKLKKVNFGHLCSTYAVNFLIDSVPNLEQLTVAIEDLGTLRKILTSCNKLTQVKLYSKGGLSLGSDDFIECVKEHGKNLTYFQCGTDRSSLNFDSLREIKKAFETQFEVIDYKFMTLLMRNDKWN